MRALSLLVFCSFLLAESRSRAFVPPKRAVSKARPDMVFVPAAMFRFGAEAQWQGTAPSSLPAAGVGPTGVEVVVASFYLDRTEVTASAYASCVNAGVCPVIAEGSNSDPSLSAACTYGKAALGQHPLNCVTHAEATSYCGFVGKRLPTDVEWELAARGKDSRPFPWGEAFPAPKHLNACDASLQREAQKMGKSYTSMWPDPLGDDGFPFTAPVGSFPEGASPYGALDLAGNVEEWLGEPWWDITPAGPPAPTPAGPPATVVVAPASSASSAPAFGQPPSTDFIVRGGAFDLNSAESFAVTRRLRTDAGTRAAWLGFRCASDG